MQASIARPVARPALASRSAPSARRASVVVRAAPTAEDVRVALEKAAKLESSKADKSEIKAAWDKVSSLSSAAAGAVFQLSEAELAARSVAADKILEDYCSANPDADECRVYDD